MPGKKKGLPFITITDKEQKKVHWYFRSFKKNQ